MVKARMDDRRFRKGDTPDDKYDSLCAINDVITDRIVGSSCVYKLLDLTPFFLESFLR